jgi:hypothetical protein
VELVKVGEGGIAHEATTLPREVSRGKEPLTGRMLSAPIEDEVGERLLKKTKEE